MMKKWEEIVKEKVEEPVGNLPDSVFEEFHARLEAGRGAMGGRDGRRGAKRRPLLWALAPSAAAVLAAVLLLHQPSAPEDAGRAARQPSTPVGVSAEKIEPAEPLVQTVAPKSLSIPVAHLAEIRPAFPTQDKESITSTGPTEEIEGTGPAVEHAAFGPVVASGSEDQSDNNIPEPITVISPYKPEGSAAGPAMMKVAPATGIVAGSGLLTAVASYLLGHDITLGNVSGVPEDFFEGDGAFDKPTGEITHHPALFKGGLSVGIPLADKLKIVTGLEYSRYRSDFGRSFSGGPAVKPTNGEKQQIVRYLGVPLRLDWSLARNYMVDVYIGAGVQADYCIGADLIDSRTEEAHRIETVKRDGFVFSLLAAGGIQVNANERIGLYLEPELIYTGGKPSGTEKESIYLMIIDGYLSPIPEINRPLTYRTEHPFMFSVSTGLRINLGK